MSSFDVSEGNLLEELSRDLTDQQLSFAEAYVATGDSLESMSRAYPHFTKPELVTKVATYMRMPYVLKYIEQLDKVVRSESEPSLDEAIIGTARIARANIADFLDSGGEIDITRASREQLFAVSEVVTEYTKGKKVTKIKMYDKQRALKDLGVHYGGFGKSVKDSDSNLALDVLLGAAEERMLSDPSKKSPSGDEKVGGVVSNIKRLPSSSSIQEGEVSEVKSNPDLDKLLGVKKGE